MRTLRRIVLALREVSSGVGIFLSLAWASLIFFLSSHSVVMPGFAPPGRAWIANLAHAPFFGLLAVFVALALRPRGLPLVRGVGTAVKVVLIVVAYSVIDELHQGLVEGRDASICDVLTDLCGVLTTLVCIRRLEGESSYEKRFALVFLVGLAACVISAALATFVPDRFPDQTWL